MRLLLLAAPLVAAAVTAAILIGVARSDGPGEPGPFVAQLVREIASNDYAGAWETLHPAHQRVAGRENYVACEAKSPIPGTVTSVSVLAVTDERVEVAGESGTVAGKAVRVRVSISGVGPDPVVLTHTSHAIAVAGRWTWILPPNRFAEYRAGRCPGS